MRILALTKYRGTNYAGWQRQPNALSIQEVIEKELSKYFNREITIYGAGRTDAGVHALGQRFHFDIDVDELDIDRLIYSLNKMLPDDISIEDMEEVEPDFHARLSAKSKIYNYLISFESKSPFFYDTCYLCPKKFDVPTFKEALKRFVGKHNFKNFTSKEEDKDNFVREIYSIDVVGEEEFLSITFRGTGFMRYMIRFIIGYAMDVAYGKYDIESIDELLDDSSERHIIASKAPSRGLLLVAVEY